YQLKTTNQSQEEGLRISRIFLYAFLSVGTGCTVVGNFLVVLSISYFKQLQSPTNSFVLSLAVADCLVGLLVMPFSMIRTVEGCWFFGPLFCRLHSSLDVMLCTASIFHLSCIAFDRYYAVCNPLVYSLKMSNSHVALLIAICWTVPMLISFGPIMLDLHVADVDIFIPSDLCVFLVSRIYAVMASLVAFYLPMAIMLVAYWKIFKAAKRQAKQISAMESQMAAGVGKDSSKKKRHRNTMKREGKAAKTLGIIMGVFLIFWMPFFTVNIVDPFIEYTTEGVVWDVFLWLGYINSSLNPFLYGFFNRCFRRAFLMFLSCRAVTLCQIVELKTALLTGIVYPHRDCFHCIGLAQGRWGAFSCSSFDFIGQIVHFFFELEGGLLQG
uniref:G-protein coupled receptors family 1 profile domain-containing protein n=1 Tax=Poecilia reticulata TaxID=8081 RepID=A0A3P9NV11_POERE